MICYISGTELETRDKDEQAVPDLTLFPVVMENSPLNSMEGAYEQMPFLITTGIMLLRPRLVPGGSLESSGLAGNQCSETQLTAGMHVVRRAVGNVFFFGLSCIIAEN